MLGPSGLKRAFLGRAPGRGRFMGDRVGAFARTGRAGDDVASSVKEEAGIVVRHVVSVIET